MLAPPPEQDIGVQPVVECNPGDRGARRERQFNQAPLERGVVRATRG